MFEIIGLFAMLVSLAVLVLPLWTFLRVRRVTSEIERLTARVAALEVVARRPAAPVIVEAPTAASAPAASPQPPPTPEAAAEPPYAPAATAAAASPPHVDHTFQAPPVEAGPGQGRAAASRAETLEGQIGGRWLLYAGLLILLLGVSFFLKYAFDNEWVDERGRVAVGLLSGMALTAGGLRLARRDLQVFGLALAGAGLAILYLSIYAMVGFYDLIDRVTAFGLLSLVTAGAVWLADRERAQPLAGVGIGGGFLTPFLVAGEGNPQLTLFSYDALLVIATTWLVYRHGWTRLGAISYVLTTVTVGAWASEHYTDALWLRTLLFLTLFGALFVIILHKVRTVPGFGARLVSMVLWTAPVVYHVAALAITSEHPPALHLYLIVFSAAGVMLTTDPHRPWIRLLVLLAAIPPMFGYLVLPTGSSWLTANIVTILTVSGVFLVGCIDRVVRQDERLSMPDLIILHVAGLGLYGLLYQTSVSRFPELRGAIAAMVAAIAGGLWYLLRRRDPNAALNAAALAATLVAVGVAVQFDGRTVVVGWAAEGAAVAWIGVRARNIVFRAGGLLLWLLAVLELSEGYFDTPAGFTAVINARSLATLFVLGVGYALAWAIGSSRDVHGEDGAGGRLEAPRIRVVIHILASFVTLMWISAEIKSFWQVRYDTPQAYLYEELMLSLGWALYGAAAIVAGLWRAYAPLRYIGMTVIGVTVLKVFFVDLWDLGGIYRVIGFLALGVLLVLVSYLYQRSRRTPAEGEA